MRQHPAGPGDPLNCGEEISRLGQDPRPFRCQYMPEDNKAGVAKIDNIKSPTVKKSGTEGGAEREGQNAGRQHRILDSLRRFSGRNKVDGLTAHKTMLINTLMSPTVTSGWVSNQDTSMTRSGEIGPASPGGGLSRAGRSPILLEL